MLVEESRLLKVLLRRRERGVREWGTKGLEGIIGQRVDVGA